MKRKSGGIRPKRSQIEEGDQAAALAAVVLVVVLVLGEQGEQREQGGGVEEAIGQEVGTEILDGTETKIEGSEESEVDRLIEAVIVGGLAVGALVIAQIIVGGLAGLRVVVVVVVVVAGGGAGVEIGTGTGTEDLDDRKEGERMSLLSSSMS